MPLLNKDNIDECLNFNLERNIITNENMCRIFTV